MAEYTHLPCVVCGKEFDENSDVVVCPVCGTPHHRECYKQLGHCANISWHEENKTYDAELEKAQIEGEQRQKEKEMQNPGQPEVSQRIVCNRCGQKNNADAVFCSHCGFPLSNGFGSHAQQGSEQRGFQGGFNAVSFAPAPNPNEDFDGVEGWKLAAVVKENQFSFMPRFMSFARRKNKVSFNFCAFLFSPLYFFYRKMYLLGILGLIIEFICTIPNAILMLTNQYLSNVYDLTVTWGLNLTISQMQALSTANYFASIVSLAVQILVGLFANYLYYRKCIKTAKGIDEKAHSKEEFLTLADKKGGTNRIIILVFLALTFVASWSISFILANGIF